MRREQTCRGADVLAALAGGEPRTLAQLRRATGHTHGPLLSRLSVLCRAGQVVALDPPPRGRDSEPGDHDERRWRLGAALRGCEG